MPLLTAGLQMPSFHPKLFFLFGDHPVSDHNKSTSESMGIHLNQACKVKRYTTSEDDEGRPGLPAIQGKAQTCK